MQKWSRVANHMYREVRAHPDRPNIDPHPASLSTTLRPGRPAGKAGAEKQSGKVAVKRDPNGNGGTEAPTPRIEECLWFSYELRIHGQANPLSFVVDSIFLAIDPTIYAHRNRVVATAL